MPGPRPRSRARPGLVAASVALIAGLGALRATELDAPPRFDGAGYAVLAVAIAEGRGYRAIEHPDAPRHAHFPPGYPATLAALWSRTGPSARAAHLASVAFTAAAAVASWAWFRRLYPPAVADLLGLAVAVNWTWHRNGGSIQSEPLYLLLSGLVLLAATAVGRRGGAASGAALGALLGAATLTRHVAGALAAAVVLDLVLRRRARAAAAAGLVALATVLPWAAWLRSVGTDTQAGLLATGGLAGRLPAQAAFYLRRLPDALTGPFVEVATAFGGSRPVAMAADAWALAASGLMAAGWLALARSPRRRLAGLAPASTLALLLAWPFTEAGRFLVPLVPFLVVGAAEGLARVARRLRLPLRRRRAAALVLAASLPYASYALLRDRAAAQRATYADFDAACAWIAAEAPAPGPVLASHPGEVSWLTGRRAIAPDSDDPAAVEALAERYGVAYVLLDDGRYARAAAHPLSRFVLGRPWRLREVWRRGPAGASTAVYAFR